MYRHIQITVIQELIFLCPGTSLSWCRLSKLRWCELSILYNYYYIMVMMLMKMMVHFIFGHVYMWNEWVLMYSQSTCVCVSISMQAHVCIDLIFILIRKLLEFNQVCDSIITCHVIIYPIFTYWYRNNAMYFMGIIIVQTMVYFLWNIYKMIMRLLLFVWVSGIGIHKLVVINVTLNPQTFMN